MIIFTGWKSKAARRRGICPRPHSMSERGLTCPRTRKVSVSRCSKTNNHANSASCVFTNHPVKCLRSESSPGLCCWPGCGPSTSGLTDTWVGGAHIPRGLSLPPCAPQRRALLCFTRAPGTHTTACRLSLVLIHLKWILKKRDFVTCKLCDIQISGVIWLLCSSAAGLSSCRRCWPFSPEWSKWAPRGILSSLLDRMLQSR